eukprot:TRINITY_DN718_c0_g1_i1.p1 TRINITY_DN718_c0_g1~~TRINITY_DN718_c0_g1_i1.p1  ORF type:complete len:762 (+),score=325.80 TRINITY_DN718_c0_g1_i1:65-2287(+)
MSSDNVVPEAVVSAESSVPAEVAPVEGAPAAVAPADKKKKAKAPKKAKADGKEEEDKSEDDAPVLFLKPDYIDHRLAMYAQIKAEQDAAFAALPREPISISLPDGNIVQGTSYETTPLDVASGISKGLAARMIVAKVDGKVWDLTRPLERSCSLVLCDFNTEEGKHTFWHSSAHILGQALEAQYGAHLCIGPPIDDGGFYYDSFMGDINVHSKDYLALTTHMNRIVKEKQVFERVVLTKQQALEMFQHNPFKVEIISSKIPDGDTVTCYRCGPLIDLCRGPHLPNTSYVKALAITKNSGCYWGGDASKPSLQRVYAISFPEKQQLKEYQALMAAAAARDHRKIGVDQSLFFFHPLSPGSCFFLPHGARLYNTLVEFIRREYRKRGYSEVVTPNVYNVELWSISGHLQNYKDHMFIFRAEDQEFGVKPMNCPGHCLMFAHTKRSYRELPLRMADFGVLHRNEFSGALTGLTRVRRFQQDDAHIFCAMNQIEQEVGGVLDMLQYVYNIFGFDFELSLSTRPEKYLGDLETWEQAESALAACLDRFGREWKVNKGDGAFYGPKIDIIVFDALKRRHQCATIQLDFQLPIRFKLQYQSDHNNEMLRPVIVHRAILGSVERMIAILCEHTAGKWPLWLSPRQVAVLPVSEKNNRYAELVRDEIHRAGFYVDLDTSNHTVAKKVLLSQADGYNFMLVVGPHEEEHGTVTIRVRDEAPNSAHEEIPIAAFIQKLQYLRDTFDGKVQL